MKKALTLVALSFFFFYGNSQIVAPAVMNTGGGTAQSGYYQFEWSIGELALVGDMTNSGNSLVITNGFIQSLIQYPSRNNSDYTFGNDEIKIFPNPASSFVEINFLTKQRGRITISFYDGAGKTIYTSSDPYYGVGKYTCCVLTSLRMQVILQKMELLKL
jgi:hypothetical protein